MKSIKESISGLLQSPDTWTAIGVFAFLVLSTIAIARPKVVAVDAEDALSESEAFHAGRAAAAREQVERMRAGRAARKAEREAAAIAATVAPE